MNVIGWLILCGSTRGYFVCIGILEKENCLSHNIPESSHFKILFLSTSFAVAILLGEGASVTSDEY